MTPALCPARPLDAGAVGAILHDFETGTPWMPKQHSGAEAIAFGAAMIDRGWVTVAVEAMPQTPAVETVYQLGATEVMGQGSGGGGLGASAPSPPPPLLPRPDRMERLAEGTVLGFLALEGEKIHALYVAPGWTGRGIGRHLLDRAKALSPRLRLWAFEANHGAQNFYLREGFAEIRRTDGAGNDEGLRDIQFAWERSGT